MATLLEKQQEHIKLLEKKLERLEHESNAVGTVIAVSGNKALVLAAGAYVEAPCHGMKLGVGDVVGMIDGIIAHKLDETMQLPGPVGMIIRMEHGMAVVEHGGNTLEVACGLDGAQAGDSVRLDMSGTVVVRLYKGEKKAVITTGVSFDDIGGYHAEKKEIMTLIEHAVHYRKAYERYGTTAPSGLLLYGPPGNGKTMFGKAMATAIGGEPGAFISMKGPEVLDSYVGVAEARIREAFRSARAFYRNHGKPAVLFIDEADSILNVRGARKSSDVDRTIVAQFLTEMDGIEKEPVFTVLTTNMSAELDPAVVRDGRIDRRIRIGRPDRESGASIYKTLLDKMPSESGTAEAATEVAYSEDVLTKDETPLHTKVSGAILAGTVRRAAAAAIERDIKTKKEGKVTPELLAAAIRQSAQEIN